MVITVADHRFGLERTVHIVFHKSYPVLEHYLCRWGIQPIFCCNNVQDYNSSISCRLRSLCDHLLSRHLLWCLASLATLPTTSNHSGVPSCTYILRTGITSVYSTLGTHRPCKQCTKQGCGIERNMATRECLAGSMAHHILVDVRANMVRSFRDFFLKHVLSSTIINSCSGSFSQSLLNTLTLVTANPEIDYCSHFAQMHNIKP